MKYGIHPIANIWPEMDDDTFARLKESVGELFDDNHPVWLYENMILDGRHRARAADELGIKYPTKEFIGSWREAMDFAKRENDYRRHMSVGQRAMVAESMANIQHGGNRKDQEGKRLLENVTVESAARYVGVDATSVRRARELRAIAPAAAERVKQGKESLGGALKKAKKAAAETKPIPKSPPPPPVDALGKPVRSKSSDALLAGRGRFMELIRILRSTKKELHDLCDHPFGRCLHWQTVETDLKNLINNIDKSAPYTTCPLNGGECDSKCQVCRGSQWVSELQWGGIPKEHK
mgnify:CR=1 FL=1